MEHVSHRDGASVSPTGATGDSSCARKRAVGIFFRGDKKRVHNREAPSALPDAEHAHGSARRPNPTNHPRHAPSIGAARCWLRTTPHESPSERYTTAPGAVQRHP
eukprot:scaffold93761_cov59-Phaeocystis_antarctica.AAC.1